MKKALFFLIILTGSLFLTSCFNNNETDNNIYKIEYYVNDELVELSPNIYVSDLMTYLPDYSEEGHVFSGWYNNSNLTGITYNTISEGQTGDKKFYATLLKEYELTLNFYGGNEVLYQKVFTKNDEIILPTNVEYEGHIFDGWYDSEDGNRVYKVDVGTEENKIFYAMYTFMPSIVYNLNLDFNGGNEVEYDSVIDQTVDYILPVDVYKENYEFLGWYKYPILYGDRVYKIEAGSYTDYNLYAIFELSSELFNGLDMPDTETLVTSNLTFPTTTSGYDVSIVSSNENIIGNDGILKRDYDESFVTITANITDYVSTISKDFTYIVDGYKSLDGPIRSGYIFREYYKANDYFFLNQEIVYTAFAIADVNGDFPNINAYLGNVRSNIMPKAKENGVRVLMSVGPGTEWGYFSKTEALRENFATNIVVLINEHGFDGVNIDWEVPRPAYGENLLYTLLMEAVHRKVKENNPRHLVTTAITGGNSQPPKYDLRNSEKYLDYVNIMTYGMASSQGMYQNALYGRSSFHNPGFLAGRPPSQATIDDSIRIFNNYGIENKRLIVGVAFYGIKQTRTYDENTNIYGPWTISGGGLHYLDIQIELAKNGYQRVYDEVSQVPYIINSNGTVFISYDDVYSIKIKAEYILDNEIGGMMYWEHMHDHDNILLKAMVENMPRN